MGNSCSPDFPTSKKVNGAPVGSARHKQAEYGLKGALIIQRGCKNCRGFRQQTFLGLHRAYPFHCQRPLNSERPHFCKCHDPRKFCFSEIGWMASDQEKRSQGIAIRDQRHDQGGTVLERQGKFAKNRSPLSFRSHIANNSRFPSRQHLFCERSAKAAFRSGSRNSRAVTGNTRDFIRSLVDQFDVSRFWLCRERCSFGDMAQNLIKRESAGEHASNVAKPFFLL